MKRILPFFLIIALSSLSARCQVSVSVHPGTELLNVVQLLSDSAQVTRSTYQQDIIEYFGKYKDHPAVQKARDLPFINCDFPLRMSWAFYNFPNIKLYQFDTLGAYNRYFQTEMIINYFKACIDFYKVTRFHKFYRKYRREYGKWIDSFNRNLYEKGMLMAIDSFYGIRPVKEVVFTLGALNCGSYAIPDMRPINPIMSDKMVIMVAYGNIVGRKDSAHLHPDFYSPTWASQLIWHEAGHAYIAGLFEKYKNEIDTLEYIFANDTTLKKAAGNLDWPMYLNENVTQAVTSLLRIQRGITNRDTEIKRVASGGFYVLAPLMIDAIEQWYDKGRYADFGYFFPVLLQALKEKYNWLPSEE